MLPVKKKIKENNLFASEGLCIASTWGELFIFLPSFVAAWVEMPRMGSSVVPDSMHQSWDRDR